MVTKKRDRPNSPSGVDADHERRLATFLDALDPLQSAYVRGHTSDAILQAEFSSVSPQRDREYERALLEYYQLAIRVPAEWRRVCRRLTPGQVEILELKLIGRARRRGAPKIPAAHRADVRVAQAVEVAEKRLAAGMALRREYRRRGGYYSDDEAIREELIDRGYRGNELNAILGAKTPRGAGLHLVALGSRSSVESVGAQASRGRRYLRSLEAPGRKP